MATYTYASDGSYSTGLAWPPPATAHDDTLSGSPIDAIAWRREAGLAIVFAATDTPNACPFVPGYNIPTELPCRSGPFVPARTIPMSLLHQTEERWGYLDDQDWVPAPLGAYCISDWQYATQSSDILVVGLDFGGWGEPGNYLAAMSAMTGASLDEATNGNVLNVSSFASNSVEIADELYSTVQVYAARLRTTSIDLVFAVDNTGSMGSRSQVMKDAAVNVTGRLLADGTDANFAFATFADWGPTDTPKAAFPSVGWGEDGDDPYNLRFPFGPLTTDRQAAFTADDYPGQGGADSPETLLEALCRIYVARQAIAAGVQATRVHFW